MEKIKPHLTDYEKDLLDGIYCSKMRYQSINYKSLNIYNRNIEIPEHKIWIAAPIMRLANPIFPPNSKFNQSMPVTVFLNRINLLHRKFNKFIWQLEKKIATLVKNYDLVNVEQNVKHKIDKLNKKANKITHKSSIKDYNGYKNLSLNIPFHKVGDCYEFAIKIFNKYNDEMSLVNIPHGSKVLMFIELSNVWVSDTKCGFNWTILQMQVFPEFDFSICYFDKEEDDEKNKQTECYHCLYCPNMHVRTHCCNTNSQQIVQPQIIHVPVNNISTNYERSAPPPPPPLINSSSKEIKLSGFAPSVKDLLSIKLKPVNIINDDNSSSSSDGTEDELDVLSCMLKSKEKNVNNNDESSEDDKNISESNDSNEKE